jgi:hypothetical protein
MRMTVPGVRVVVVVKVSIRVAVIMGGVTVGVIVAVGGVGVFGLGCRADRVAEVAVRSVMVMLMAPGAVPVCERSVHGFNVTRSRSDASPLRQAFAEPRRETGSRRSR